MVIYRDFNRKFTPTVRIQAHSAWMAPICFGKSNKDFIITNIQR